MAITWPHRKFVGKAATVCKKKAAHKCYSVTSVLSEGMGQNSSKWLLEVWKKIDTSHTEKKAILTNTNVQYLNL